mmetsp:Transcript_53855/g.166733  ORF Transcript_53855/g.166733 Transcript_53855/m.166733 type:complete len:242 (-) Transcript_53855:970-1695(-)
MPAPCPTAPRRTTGAGSRCGPGGRGRSPVDEGVLRRRHGRRHLVGVRDVLKIRDVLCVLHRGLVGRGRRHGLQLLELERREPLVLEDIGRAVLEVPVALAEVGGEELLHQGLGVLVEVLREVDLASKDLLVDAHGVLVAEGRLAADHLVDEDAQGPPVHRVRVTRRGQQLRRKVVWRAAGREGLADDKLRKAHVCDLEVPPLAQHEVLRLQVPVDDAALVKVLEGIHHAGRVVPCVLLAAV